MTNSLPVAEMDPNCLVEELAGRHAFFVEIQSAPTACVFSRMCGTVVYDDLSKKLRLNEVFVPEISTSLLEGKTGDADTAAAVERLWSVLKDDKSKQALVATLEEQGTKRVQFAHIADSVLQKLTTSMVVNAKTYTSDFLHSNSLTVRSRTIGMGNTRTWRGHPDGLAKWSPLNALSCDSDDDDGVESGVESSGKRYVKLSSSCRRHFTTRLWAMQ